MNDSELGAAGGDAGSDQIDWDAISGQPRDPATEKPSRRRRSHQRIPTRPVLSTSAGPHVESAMSGTKPSQSEHRHRSSSHGRRTRRRRFGRLTRPFRHHPAFSVLCVILVASIPVLLSFVRGQWFFGDEWDFIARRSLTNPGDLLRPHDEHWSTLPIIAYRLMYTAFGVQHYQRYQLMIIVAHLVVVALLWMLLRRHHVDQWVALVVVLPFLLFGPGWQNILWPFQIGFVGSVAFGLVQVLLVDRDDPISRLDALALVAGLAALMCSGIGVPMVAAAALTALLRRGWRPALLQVGPLAAVYLIWYGVERPSTVVDPHHRGIPTVAQNVVQWDGRTFWDGVRALGHNPLLAVGLLAMTVAGLALAWLPQKEDAGELRARAAGVVGMLGGGVVFLVITALGRWYVPYPARSRYEYLVVVFLLPAIGVAADALIRRSAFAAPVLAVLAVALVALNFHSFHDYLPSKSDVVAEQAYVWQLAHNGLIKRMPPDALVDPDTFDGGIPARWLRDAAEHKSLPGPPKPLPPFLASQQLSRVLTALDVRQLSGAGATGKCQLVRGPVTIKPREGTILGVAPRFGNPPRSIAIQMIVSKVTHTPVVYSLDRGSRFQLRLGAIPLRITASPAVSYLLCQ